MADKRNKFLRCCPALCEHLSFKSLHSEFLDDIVPVRFLQIFGEKALDEYLLVGIRIGERYYLKQNLAVIDCSYNFVFFGNRISIECFSVFGILSGF